MMFWSRSFRALSFLSEFYVLGRQVHQGKVVFDAAFLRQRESPFEELARLLVVPHAGFEKAERLQRFGVVGKIPRAVWNSRRAVSNSPRPAYWTAMPLCIFALSGTTRRAAEQRVKSSRQSRLRATVRTERAARAIISTAQARAGRHFFSGVQIRATSRKYRSRVDMPGVHP